MVKLRSSLVLDVRRTVRVFVLTFRVSKSILMNLCELVETMKAIL